MKNKKIKCDIYTRVSTTMQVDGYSLDAQKEKLKRYAEFQNMEIVNEYSDEGKSGKSVEGRPEFQRMLDNIENGTDEVQFVLVFKLSRFGRNAADVLNSLQRMQDFGVNLICVEDGIDSSKDSGKLMISVLSAVAEIERENILVQTMEGRKQKAREGKWNGGFAPYGYELVNGELQIAEDEAEIICLIYDKFIHTNMGISAIAAWLNQHGYKKKKRQNNTLDAFAASFIKGVLDNPVYCGKLAYGRRKNEKVSGTRNEYRIVKQENYMLHDGIHEGIISETDWELAHQKREKTGVKYEKTHSLEHEHILSGILRCPLCGSGMYGNVNRKKKKDGTLYKDYFYYACKHRRLVDGHKCGYRKQWSEEKINNAVEDVIRKLVKNPKFEEAILNKIGSRIDTEEIEKEIERLEKQHRQLTGAKARLGQQMDSLDIMDKFYEKKYQDMETRLYRLYDEIEGVENSIEEVKNRLLNIRQQKISEENVYQFLLYMLTILLMEKKEKKRYIGLSSTDALTGILNRRAFQVELEEQIRKKEPGFFIFIDVDNFKSYNDTYGHNNGDLCLKHFAKAIQECFPEGSILGRYGGDEFVVYLKDVTKESVYIYMEKFQKMIEDLTLATGEQVHLSASAGGAAFPEQGEDFISLCRSADVALYNVKQNGKAAFKIK